jgi:hypothetical protein
MHPLHGTYKFSMRLPKPYVAVVAQRHKNQLIVQPGALQIVKPDTLFASLRDTRLQVVNEDGTLITASGEFYVSLETIDPMHLIIDWQKQM